VMREVWPDQLVEEGNLTRNVSTLRKALGESRDDHRYIVTIPGRGYRFKDQAFAWLARACEERDEQIVMIKVDPKMDGLRSDPRFSDLLRSIGLLD